MITAYIGIGANLGDALGTVKAVISDISKLPSTRLSGQSSLFRTAPVDAGGDDYINAVVRIETELTAQSLHAQMQALEQAAGRERPYRNAPRTLDLDLLLYGAERIASEHLIVPHPRMTQRAFVLIPLLQIDPFISIPGHGPAHLFVPMIADQAIQKIAD